MLKYLVALLVVIALLVGGFYVLNSSIYNEKQGGVEDYKVATFVIDGAPIVLGTEGTAYFGNEAKGDLNDDGIVDFAFIITQNGGGSGTFVYAVAAFQNSAGRYIGSNGILLDDRIAPQTTEIRNGILIVNYADRKPGEPMAAAPSLGVSAYIYFDGMQLVAGQQTGSISGDGSVGEFWGTIYGAALLGPTCPVVMDPPDPECADKPFKTSLVVTTPDGARVVKQFSTDDNGKFNIEIPPGEYAIRSAAAANILPYCQSGVFSVKVNDSAEVNVSCDTGIR